MVIEAMLWALVSAGSGIESLFRVLLPAGVEAVLEGAVREVGEPLLAVVVRFVSPGAIAAFMGGVNALLFAWAVAVGLRGVKVVRSWFP